MCFLVPLTQAIATTVYRVCPKQTDTFVRRNLKTLELMLWGGTIMLLVDHLINGEFLAWNPMELLTVGLPMSLAVTAIWAIWSYGKEIQNAKFKIKN